MYEAFFGFCRRPFSGGSLLEDYFPSASIEGARQTVQQCFERGAGWAMVVGPAGLGKTLLCYRLAQDLQKSFRVLLLSGGGLSGRRELWQTFLFGLGQPYRGMEEGELRLALVEYLAEQRKQSAGFIVLVDEAHLLAGKLLEEIRILGQAPVLPDNWFQVLLAGMPILEERLSSPRLEAVQQRIVVRCYLEPWTRMETLTYIRTQLEKVAAKGDRLMGEGAAEAVFQATNGIPRLVNQLCDHALWWAWKHQHRQLDARIVQEAWADLQQLPPPSVATGGGGPGPGLIEFGLLEEDDQPQPPSASEEPIPHGPSASLSYAGQQSPQEHGAAGGQRGIGPNGVEGSGLAEAYGLPLHSPAKDLVSSEGELRQPRGEGEIGSGPEQEFFFGALPQRDSEGRSAWEFVEEESSSKESNLPSHLSAWDRLQQIELALSQMGSSATNPSDMPNGPLGGTNFLPNQGSPGFDQAAAGGRSQDCQPPGQSHGESPSQSEPGSGSCKLLELAEVGAFSETQPQAAPTPSGSSPTHGPKEKSLTIPPVSAPSNQASGAFSSGGGTAVSEAPVDSGRLPSEAPEVELVFPSSGASTLSAEASPMEINPFTETFLEEQWIEDPYLQVGMEGHRPWSVLGWLRNESSSLEKMAGKPSSMESLSGGEPSCVGTSDCSDPRPIEPGAAKEVACSPKVLSFRGGGVGSSGGWLSQPPTPPPEPPLIVIEEALLEEPMPEQRATVMPVGRHEYRRLFARLRRGGKI